MDYETEAVGSGPDPPGPTEGEEKQLETGVRQVHRRVTSPRRRERPFSVRAPRPRLPGPRRRLLGNVQAVGGPGLNHREEGPGVLASPRGRAGSETLPADGVASLSAVCRSADLAKGQEAAASGLAVSEGRRCAPPLASSRSSTSTLAKQDSVGEQRVKRRRPSVPNMKSKSSRRGALVTKT